MVTPATDFLSRRYRTLSLFESPLFPVCDDDKEEGGEDELLGGFLPLPPAVIAEQIPVLDGALPLRFELLVGRGAVPFLSVIISNPGNNHDAFKRESSVKERG